jgi:multiple sugar transport system substrate-binding protein
MSWRIDLMTSRYRHSAHLLLIAAVAVATAAACSKKKDEPAAQGSAAATAPAAAAPRTLVINADTSDPSPKEAFGKLIAGFEAANPDIKVKLNVFDHEGFKTAIRNFLSSEAPDVVTWYAGNRMNAFVQRNLFEDVSDLWKDHNLGAVMASTQANVTVDGKQYGMPYTYYPWGVYYRKDLFEQHGLAVPTNWAELIAVCKALKAKGIAPFAIGTKHLWPAAGWFDYLNLRVNGRDFHLGLMNGTIPYTDDRVKAVFAKWRELIDPGFYIENHATYSWQEAQAFLYNGKAAMYLMGNFLVPNLPPEVADKMSSFQFPLIDPAVGLYEDAPTDTLHIPAQAKNKADARKFLLFAADAANQTMINGILKQLPPNKDAKVADDPYLQRGFKMLQEAKGLTQFYDRDTEPEMAKLGMEGIQEFMLKPDRLGEILERLEKARQRIFK